MFVLLQGLLIMKHWHDNEADLGEAKEGCSLVDFYPGYRLPSLPQFQPGFYPVLCCKQNIYENKIPSTSVDTFLDHSVYKSVFERLHANFEVLRRKVYRMYAQMCCSSRFRYWPVTAKLLVHANFLVNSVLYLPKCKTALIEDDPPGIKNLLEKYCTFNFIHFVHKACQTLSTFTNECHSPSSQSAPSPSSHSLLTFPSSSLLFCNMSSFVLPITSDTQHYLWRLLLVRCAAMLLWSTSKSHIGLVILPAAVKAWSPVKSHSLTL